MKSVRCPLGMALLLSLCLHVRMVHAASWWNDEDYVHGISVVPVPDLAIGLLAGTVLFVDTREPEEYAEKHIPGAINIRLVDVDGVDAQPLQKYQYVVPYCLKDFRGFEVARALREYKGLSNVVMMAPSGMKGWESQGLPLSSSNAEGMRKLAEWHKNSALTVTESQP